MRKLITFIVIATLICSCTKSPEDIVKEEFTNYVHLNFDDPNSIEEILLISQPDTISFDSIFNLGKGVLADIDSLKASIDEGDSLKLILIQSITNDRKMTNYVRRHLYDDPYIEKMIIYLRDMRQNAIDNIADPSRFMEEKQYADRLKEYVADTTINYSRFAKRTIRFRQNIQGEKKIDSLYYIIKDGGTPYFSKEDVQIKDFNEKSEDIALTIGGALGELNSLVEKRKGQIDFERNVNIIRERAYQK